MRLLLLFCCSLPLAAQTDYDLSKIFPRDTPVVQHVWTRIGDRSQTFRSVESAALSPDATRVVSGSKFGYDLMLWRVLDGALIFQTNHPSEIECVGWSPDGRTFAAGDEHFDVRVYDGPTGTLLQTLPHPHALDGLHFSPDGRYLAAGDEGGWLHLWDTRTWSKVDSVKTGDTINSVDFSADGRRVFVAGFYWKNDLRIGHVRQFSVDPLREIRTYPGGEMSCKSVRLHPDGRWLAMTGFDEVVRIYEVETGRLVRQFTTPERSEAVAWHPSGHWLAVGGVYRNVLFYETRNWTLVHTLPTPHCEYIDFAASGREMATAHERSGTLMLHVFETMDRPDGAHTYEVLNNRDQR